MRSPVPLERRVDEDRVFNPKHALRQHTLCRGGRRRIIKEHARAREEVALHLVAYCCLLHLIHKPLEAGRHFVYLYFAEAIGPSDMYGSTT